MAKPRARGGSSSSRPRFTPKRGRVFNATRDASTKANIKHNATNSPLMILPLEIRTMIFREVLGDRVIHIKEFAPPRPPIFLKFTIGPLEHFICTTPESLDDDYHRFKNCVKANADFAMIEHSGCKRKPGGDIPDQGKQLDLRVLRVCRQLYNECNYLLWTTNTFSIDNPKVFDAFINARSTIQKKLLKSLHLPTDHGHGDTEGWDRAIKMELVRSLAGLRELRLVCSYLLPPCFPREFLDGTLDTFKTTILRFQVLAITKAEIIVDDKFNDEALKQDRPELLWGLDNQRKVADRFEQIILDPKGAENYSKLRVGWLANKSKLRWNITHF